MAHHIPDEILVEIFSCMPSPDLARVALASRRFFFIAQPILYTSPALQDQTSHILPLQCFIRTLLTPSGQHLANHIRHLTVAWSDTKLDPSSSDYPIFHSAIVNHELPNEPITGDMQLMLLLHLIPRLFTFHLDPPPTTRFFHLLAANHNYSRPPTTFPPSLQTLHELRCASHIYVSVRHLTFLLGLTNIQTLGLAIYGNMALLLRGGAAQKPHSSQVQTLEFPSVKMPHHALANILAIPRALTRFSFCAPHWASLFRLERALQGLKGALRELRLDFSKVSPGSNQDWDKEEEGGNLEMGLLLRDWSELRAVEASMVVLFGFREWKERVGRRGMVEVLPVGVRMVRVLEDRFWTADEAVEELMGVLEKWEMVPGLEGVGLGDGMQVEKEILERLQRGSEQAGVRILGPGEILSCV